LGQITPKTGKYYGERFLLQKKKAGRRLLLVNEKRRDIVIDITPCR